jgi:hypothetical protein
MCPNGGSEVLDCPITSYQKISGQTECKAYVDWEKETEAVYDHSKNVVGEVESLKAARITVAADNDAVIGLSESSKHSIKRYEVVIGGGGNTASVMRYENWGKIVSIAWGKHLGGINHPKTFELDWSDGISLKLFSVEQDDIKLLMSAPLVPDIPIKIMTVTTDLNSRGKWNIQLLD